MLDVHPPHSAAHTWKDFWIHLGTIAAGLLIAIGLEQTVEVIHRSHERHLLQRYLREEAESNQAILDHDLSYFQQTFEAEGVLRARADSSSPGSPQSALPSMPAEVHGDPLLPSGGAWTSARDSNELGLLPRELCSMYEELYAQREFIQHPVFDQFATAADLSSFTKRHGAQSAWLDPVLLSPDDRRQYALLLDRDLTALSLVSGYTYFYQHENQAVVRGALTTDDLHRAVDP